MWLIFRKLPIKAGWWDSLLALRDFIQWFNTNFMTTRELQVLPFGGIEHGSLHWEPALVTTTWCFFISSYKSRNNHGNISPPWDSARDIFLKSNHHHLEWHISPIEQKPIIISLNNFRSPPWSWKVWGKAYHSFAYPWSTLMQHPHFLQ